MSALRIAVIDGDGIGPEVVEGARIVLARAAETHGVEVEFVPRHLGFPAFEKYGRTVPEGLVEELRTFDGVVLGPVDHARYPKEDPRYPNPSGTLRKELKLYGNIRPVRTMPGLPMRFGPVDLVVVRENTEGFYADRNTLDGSSEMRIDEDTVVSMRVVTRRASEEVARVGFELARRRGATRVTLAHKANVLWRGDGLFLKVCREVAADYPEITVDDRHVDALALDLVLDPSRFQVIITTNMFGDILSDEAAGLVGGLGLAPGLNVGPDVAVAQAVHGSAPDIAGRGIADPIAEILSGQLLLAHLAGRRADERLAAAAAAVTSAVEDAVADGGILTPDLGGSASTLEFAEAIADRIRVA